MIPTTRRGRRTPSLAIACALALSGGAALAQLPASQAGPAFSARPFLSTVATHAGGEGQWLVYSDTGYGERGQDPIRTDGLQEYLGVQGRFAGGWTLLGRIGLGSKEEGGVGSLEEAELLKDVSSGAIQLSGGLGLRREPDGSMTALGRLVLGRASRTNAFFSNVRFERSFEGGRDGLDLIASISWMHRLGEIGSAGVEVLGQDIEGLWEPEESEGGARIYVGPTIHVAIPATRLYAALAVGPVFQASRSPRTSSAPRDLSARSGYSVRLSFGYQP